MLTQTMAPVLAETRFSYVGLDGTPLAAFRWAASGIQHLGVLQVAHGAAEHSGRYLEPLEPLLQAGFIIYAADHRGHGLTSGTAHLGDFGPAGPSACVDDMGELAKLARGENPGLPLVLLGHSLGAAFAQLFLRSYSSLLSGLILSGSSMPSPPPSGGWGSGMPGARTEYDWLTRDRRVVDKYIADIFCGRPFSAAAEASLVALRSTRAQLLECLPDLSGLPVYVVAGDADPVNDQLRGLLPLIGTFEKAGAAVTRKIYAGARHEPLNEINRDEVVTELLEWLARSVISPANNGPVQASTAFSAPSKELNETWDVR